MNKVVPPEEDCNISLRGNNLYDFHKCGETQNLWSHILEEPDNDGAVHRWSQKLEGPVIHKEPATLEDQDH